MKTVRHLGAALAIGALIGTSPLAMAQSAGDGSQVMHEGKVAYVSGGVGVDSLRVMHDEAKHYNLRMQFALRGSGMFLANVGVYVKDRKGNAVLDTMADGPCLFAKVPRGRYMVSVEINGVRKSADAVVGSSPVNMPFYWTAKSIGERGRMLRHEEHETMHAQGKQPRNCW